MTDIQIAKKMVAIQTSANSRLLRFDLSFSETKKLMTTKKCFFTGNPLNEKTNDPNKRSFDRIDNKKGYVNGNVVACSESFNKRKGNLTIDEITILFKALQKKNLV
jgi:hypothetical protein